MMNVISETRRAHWSWDLRCFCTLRRPRCSNVFQFKYWIKMF